VVEIEKLVDGLCKGMAAVHQAADNWVDVCLNFLKATSREYPFYLYVLQPFFHGILETCLGIAVLCSASKVKTSKKDPFVDLVTWAKQMMSPFRSNSLASLAREEELDHLGRLNFDRLSWTTTSGSSS